MNKVLMTATYGDFFSAFEVDNIKILIDNGFEVYLAADWHSKEFNYKGSRLKNIKCEKIDIDFSRSPFSIRNIWSLIKLYKIMKEKNFSEVNANNPVVGVITRIAAKFANVKNVIYTAHGFQFCKKGPKADWLLYCPIEWIMSFITDLLIVINQEDYDFASKHLHAKKVLKIPGVGVDTDKFIPVSSREKRALRNELGISEEKFVVISVGELSNRKNTIAAIKAVETAVKADKDVELLVVGGGDQYERLRQYIERKNLADNVKLLGKRKDIVELNAIADVAIFPTLREGLAVAPLESMLMGLPLISSRARGVVEYSIDKKTGFNFNSYDSEGMAKAIVRLKQDENLYKFCSDNAICVAHRYGLENAHSIMKQVINNL